MKKSIVFSKKGNYWFYHPIGVGLIFTYIPIANQIVTTCSNTGQVIEVNNLQESERFQIEEEFIESANLVYLGMIEDGFTITLDYMDNPEIVGCIGIDFDLIKN